MAQKSTTKKKKYATGVDTVFFQTAIHDLKTPLLAIKLFADSLLDTKAGSLSEKQRSDGEEIVRSADQAFAMVRDMLMVVKMRQHGLSRVATRIAMGDVLTDVLEDLRGLIQQKKITVSWSERWDTAYVIAERVAIAHVVHNLISNAVKYSKPGSHITLALQRYTREQGGLPPSLRPLKKQIKRSKEWCIVRVTDEGVGIPKNEQKKVFQQFFRASNVKTVDPYGTGLGLFLSKMIVEKSGGALWFSSQEGKGTTFFIALPCSS